MVDPLTIVGLATFILGKYKADLPADDQKKLPEQKKLEAFLARLNGVGDLLDSDFSPAAFPETLTKLEGFVGGWKKGFKIPGTVKILADFLAAFDSHQQLPGMQPRTRLARKADAFDPKLVQVATKTFWFWVDEENLPIVTDDRPGSGGDSNKDVARGAYLDAWNSWADVIKVQMMDLWFHFEFGEMVVLQFNGATDAEIAAAREAAKAKADLVVLLTDEMSPGVRLPANYLAYTTVGQNAAASRGMVMKINKQKQSWSYSEFRGVIAHEIGHLLGLDDDQINQNVLMSATKYQHTPNEPTSADVTKARGLGW